jgi:Domain of unknown function (DUF4424)
MRSVWIVVLTTAVLPISANDTLAMLGAGGLVPAKSSNIVMESEDLEVSVHQITVRYVFRNLSGRDIDATVVFPLPELDGGLVENEPINLPSGHPLNFIDFRVVADGKVVATQVEARAFKDGKEITGDLLSLSMPVSPLDTRIRDVFTRLPAAVQNRVLRAVWMVGCSGPRDSECWPYWQVRIQYHWMQRFPAKSRVQIEHVYRPVVGGSYIVRDDDGESSVKPYCGGADALAAIKKANTLHPLEHGSDTLLLERRIQYILTTANNWSGPIRNFRLAIISDFPEDIVATCMPGVKRTAPTRYELVRSNFRPDRELDADLAGRSKIEQANVARQSVRWSHRIQFPGKWRLGRVPEATLRDPYPDALASSQHQTTRASGDRGH